MKKSRFTEEQIAYALRLAEGGTPVADVCRQLGISDATFYTWKKKYAELGVSELRKLKQLEDENARLRRIVADLTLDKQILQRSAAGAQHLSPSRNDKAAEMMVAALLSRPHDEPAKLRQQGRLIARSEVHDDRRSDVGFDERPVVHIVTVQSLH